MDASPSYPYYKYVKSPSELGMSSQGSLSALGKDVAGLVSYVELLVSGKSKASATGQPLGDKFFLKSGASCVDPDGNKQDRYIYVDNVPAGNVPFISSGMGVNFSEFRGLIPGTISNLNAFNPAALFHAFSAGSSPDCQSLTMETIDTQNHKSTETHFVTLADIDNMDPCIFPDKKNPRTGQKCQESFASMTAPPAAPPSTLSLLVGTLVALAACWLLLALRVRTDPLTPPIVLALVLLGFVVVGAGGS